jgi:hypothetical protein
MIRGGGGINGSDEMRAVIIIYLHRSHSNSNTTLLQLLISIMH